MRAVQAPLALPRARYRRQPAAQAGPQFLYLSVENVDEAYHELLEKDLKPVSEPRNRPGGIREFMRRDPDGSLLVFFRKK
jgi:Glyoxalase/Bleomycin resistance protein/Dioxygenase superfamily